MDQREILYQILKYCAETRTKQEAEAFITGRIESVGFPKKPAAYLALLVTSKGLDCTVISDGQTFSLEEYERFLDCCEQEQAETATPDSSAEGESPEEPELFYKTTPEGIRFCEEMEPKSRFEALCANHPELKGAYLAILEFCREARSLADIDAKLQAEGLRTKKARGQAMIYPSMVVDQLRAAGGLEWKSGWKSTEEGREIADQLHRETF